MKRTREQIYADPIFNALSPYGREFIETRELPQELNTFLEPYDIKMVALITFTIFPHIKTVPVVQMMLEDFRSGLYEGKHTIVVPSSGNTAHAVARLAQAFGFNEVKVVLSADVPGSKRGILAALSSVDVIAVGGGKSVARRAEEEAEKPGHYLLDQYKHMGNVRAHEMFTGREIVRALGYQPAVISIAMGSGGTAAGVGYYCKRINSKTVVLGVRPKLGEQVPGARDAEKMRVVVTLPWSEAVSHVIEVSRKDSFISTRRLWSAIEPQPGPTSGLAWRGLMDYLTCLEPSERENLRGKCAAFICPDDGRFYSDQILSELDTDQGL